jgi:hypothetical protein
VTEPAAAPLIPAPDSSVIRLLCGVNGNGYVDRMGRAWGADRYFTGGAVYETRNKLISGTPDPRLYQSRREGSFRYDIPLKPGMYELRLYFAETVYGEHNDAGGGEGSRVFGVFVNGKQLQHDIDVIADAGASTADIRSFKVAPAADGALHLTFLQFSNAPMVSAIEILPCVSGKIQTIRLISRDRAYTDTQGNTWAPDVFARGGQVVTRQADVTNTKDPELYRGERYGNISYFIPVPKGRYTVKLYFSETWFGPDNPGKGGAGSRLFDILCNGVALKRNFDIYEEAGGSNRAVTWTGRGLEPNHQGKLAISLVPAENYACINALEVIEEQ